MLAAPIDHMVWRTGLPVQWYMEIRNMKALQTTGWVLGVEQFLAWVLQHDDIRDISIIPRLKGSRFAP